MNEIFKTIEGYPLYMVSNMGRVKSLNFRRSGKEGIMSPRISGNGHLKVTLRNVDGCKDYLVHRLVAQAFLPNPNNLVEINHRDENKQNNRLDNLEWCDRKYNVNYGTTKERIGIGNSKPVIQYSKEGRLIRKWDSATKAEKEYNIGHIIECCKGKVKTAGGYVWKYYDLETYLIGVMNNNFKYAA